MKSTAVDESLSSMNEQFLFQRKSTTSNRPKMFLNYTLADFAAKLNTLYPKGFTEDESTNDMDNDLPHNDDDDDENNDQSVILLHCSNGVIFKNCQKARIMQYVNYSIKKDPENYYREMLMLFLSMEK